MCRVTLIDGKPRDDEPHIIPKIGIESNWLCAGWRASWKWMHPGGGHARGMMVDEGHELHELIIYKMRTSAVPYRKTRFLRIVTMDFPE